MSFKRVVPFFVAGFIGIVSGIYIFDPLLRKSYQDGSVGEYKKTLTQAEQLKQVEQHTKQKLKNNNNNNNNKQ